MATSVRLVKPSATRGYPAMRSSSKPKCGSATTATKRPCTPSTKAQQNSGSTPLTCCYYTRPCPETSKKTLAAYRALEKLLASGRVRAIGVSNFMVNHLQTLRRNTNVTPAVNQIEVHPFFHQRQVRDLNAALGDRKSTRLNSSHVAISYA